MLNLKIKKLSETATLPSKAHPEDACFDIYADINLNYPANGIETIPPHTTVKIHTGFATEIPSGYWGAIFARSGVATKRGLRPAQGVPVIDENYRGEWIIPLHNDADEAQVVRHGERIAQFTLLPYPEINLIEVDNLSETERGDGGFGSTGIK